MNYINTQTNEYPVSLKKLKELYPNTSFVKGIEAYGDYALVHDGVVPTYTATQYVEEGTPVQVNGRYERNWVVRDYTQEQVDSLQANRDAVAANSVRAKRNRLLAETDWVSIMHRERGTEIPRSVYNYRQALRNITEHENFPYLEEADWPTAAE